jgi:hypothetical protein
MSLARCRDSFKSNLMSGEEVIAHRAHRARLQSFLSIPVAMALLDTGVDISVIALWLGHESMETTNGDLHKASGEGGTDRFQLGEILPDDSLLAFLVLL